MRTQLATLLDFSQREAEAAPLYEQAIADYEALTPPDEETAPAASLLCASLIRDEEMPEELRGVDPADFEPRKLRSS